MQFSLLTLHDPFLLLFGRGVCLFLPHAFFFIYLEVVLVKRVPSFRNRPLIRSLLLLVPFHAFSLFLFGRGMQICLMLFFVQNILCHGGLLVGEAKKEASKRNCFREPLFLDSPKHHFERHRRCFLSFGRYSVTFSRTRQTRVC